MNVSPTKDGDFPASHVSELGGVKDLESSMFSTFKKHHPSVFVAALHIFARRKRKSSPCTRAATMSSNPRASVTENGINNNNNNKTFVLGSKLRIFPYNRGWSSTQ